MRSAPKKNGVQTEERKERKINKSQRSPADLPFFCLFVSGADAFSAIERVSGR